MQTTILTERAHEPRGASWWRENRAALTEALTVYLVARVALTLVAVLASAFLPEQSGLHPVFHRGASVWLDVWARWDSEYYLDIAQSGYGLRPELIAFFPLYPLLMASIAPWLGGDTVLSGVMVSGIAGVTALFFAFKLAAWERDEAFARRVVLYLGVFPLALFLHAVYTESLFLAVTLAAFYFARRGHWALAGCAAFLAGVTRANGVLLVFPLAVEAWEQCARQGAGHPQQLAQRLSQRLAWRHLLSIGAAPCSLLLWAVYLAWLTGDRLAFFHVEHSPPWERALSMPWATLSAGVAILNKADLGPMERAMNSLELATALLLAAASVVSWWRLPRAYAAYLCASTALLLASTVPGWPLQSVPRYSLAVFPIYFLLAQLGAERGWHRAILLVAAPLLGLFTALFATWHFIF